jgi:hypothetical protein
VVRLDIVSDQRTRSIVDGLGLSPGRATGSRTPGGNGFVRDAMNAPTPAHANRSSAHTKVFVNPRTDIIIS